MDMPLLGTGSALPAAHCVQSGMLVETDDSRVLVNCGSGVFQRLGERGVDPRSHDGVLVTHIISTTSPTSPHSSGPGFSSAIAPSRSRTHQI
jgi:hypothetical protein